MVLAALLVPPSDSRIRTRYDGARDVCAAVSCGRADGENPPLPDEQAVNDATNTMDAQMFLFTPNLPKKRVGISVMARRSVVALVRTV